MDVRYRISESRVVSGSATLPSPPLPSDSKALLDIFTTKAKGSCGVDPGPLAVRLRAVTLSALSIGDWLYGVRKRLGLVRSLMFSTFEMVRLTACTVSR